MSAHDGLNNIHIDRGLPPHTLELRQQHPHGHGMPHPPRRHPPPLARHCLWLPPPTTVVNRSHPPWPTPAHQPRQQQQAPARLMAHGDNDVALLWVCHIIQTAMAAQVGQVSRLYAVPPFFSYLIATIPSGLRNTHQPPPHHVTLCHLWHQQHVTMAM
jgi:hypothetical protein